jgi:hypothetical protein
MTYQHQFRQFAEDRLQTHLLELKTRYGNQSPGSFELIQNAYKEHKKIFSKELDKKIDDLSIENNPWQKQELIDLKGEFESREEWMPKR